MQRLVLISLIATVGQATTSYATVVSVAPGTTDAAAVPMMPPPEDILFPSGMTPPSAPAPAIAGMAPGVNVDGFSFNGVIGPIIDFSVDAGSAGAMGTAVAAQAGAGMGQQAADVYRSSAAMTNSLLFDGDGVMPGPTATPIGLSEPSALPGGVNGVDVAMAPPPMGSIYWTVDIPSLGVAPYLGMGFSGADVFTAPAGPGFAAAPAVFAPAGALGLAAGDEMDALHVVDVGTVGTFDAADTIMFSLAPMSPSMMTMGSPAFGASPADIIVISPMGPVIIPAAGLGLLPTDNITAVSSAVPEPSQIAMFTLVSVICAAATIWKWKHSSASESDELTEPAKST